VLGAVVVDIDELPVAGKVEEDVWPISRLLAILKGRSLFDILILSEGLLY
jgi:hypothetical protein